MSKTWLGESAPKWQSRCYVVLHPLAATYVQAVGNGSEATAGCSTVKQLGGRILSRRIDLRLDRPEPLVRALPHEIAHVVLADTVTGQKLPRWVDEGIALLSDPLEKQRAHYHELEVSLDRGTVFRLGELMAMTEYPDASRQATFYGQSLSLVAFLVERDSPERFLEFALAAARDGHDNALQKHYGIKNTIELHRAWLAAGWPPLIRA